MRRETSEKHWSQMEYECSSMSVYINARRGRLLDNWFSLMSTSSGFH
jgi:hypothetical protein